MVMEDDYSRSLSRTGEDAAVVEAYKDTFVTNPQDQDVGRVKDIQYAQELAKEEDRIRSYDLDSKKLQEAVETETERKIMSDMERLADFIILRNKDGKYSKAREELLSYQSGKELLHQLQQEATYPLEKPYSKLKSKRQDVKEVKDVEFYSASKEYMDRLKKYQAQRDQERNPNPEIIQEEIDDLQRKLDELKNKLQRST